MENANSVHKSFRSLLYTSDSSFSGCSREREFKGSSLANSETGCGLCYVCVLILSFIPASRRVDSTFLTSFNIGGGVLGGECI